jgi:hypothetical protein
MFLGFLGISCSRYFHPIKTITETTDAKKNVINSYSPTKFFILRQGNASYALKNISVDNVANTLSGTLAPLDQTHQLYVSAKSKKYRYVKGGKANVDIPVLNEVHIFSKNTAPVDITKAFVLPLDQIEKIEVIEHDAGRTTTSYILGGVGITLGVLAVATVIVALTKSSCPFVSVYDGNQYEVQGELFGGAVNRKLERPDFMPLKIKPLNGEFQLRISNELKERQFTNYANLMVIEHNTNVEAGIGTDGNVYQLSSPVLPTKATLNNRQDVLSLLRNTDNLTCSFNDTLNSSALNEITLDFPNAALVKKGKLVLNLKNSYWFDYLYGEFTSNFGNRYQNWKKKQESEPAEKMIQWSRDQHIPLGIYISTSSGWKEVCQLNTIGPLTNRQVVIPVDPGDIPGNTVHIKLGTGFMFWELDYAAMDFTPDSPLTVSTISPYSAVDEKGNDVLAQVIGKDDSYMAQPETGSYATLKYKFSKPLFPGRSYSVVLATSGYYEPIRTYSGKPNTAFLKTFKTPGTMAAFSKNQYLQIIREQSIIALNTKKW